MALDEVGDTRSLGGISVASAEPPLPAPAQRALTFGLLISAFRCTVQYVVLPFVLPWIGITGAIPPWLTLGLALIAIAALVRNVRYLWRLGHARKWSYLFLASVIGGALVIFAAVDLHALFRV
jgi:hypothetical protein